MIFRFGSFELDTSRIELRDGGQTVSVEPQVFALLRLLVEQRDRMVTREEIINEIWDGRFVSDSAVTSRIKSLRHALADDGKTQRYVRTIHGQGFRFVGVVTLECRVITTPIATAAATIDLPQPSSRPSIAVLPFRQIAADNSIMSVAQALPHDLITELSRLHWLFVIARGSTFRFSAVDTDIRTVRDALNVRYVLSGVINQRNQRVEIQVELCNTDDLGIVWSERFDCSLDGIHEVREAIVRAVIMALEIRIPLNEARRAQLRSPEQLDAWAMYHLGLHHMYRFNRTDNAIATSHFERAISLEPGFARAYAGLSFTFFQNAFLRYSPDSSRAVGLAERYAEQCLERDPMDPFGLLTRGRAFVLKGDLEGGLPWIERSLALNPNYAQARYSQGWVESMLGAAQDSQRHIDDALALSPIDPLAYGMLGARAMSHIDADEPRLASHWGERAARSPGAHPLIEMIAVAAHGLNGDDAKARAWAASAQARSPGLTTGAFFDSFPFRNPATRSRVTAILAQYGF
jgi:TolB-like protein/Flp pilus assembly protein TadD